MTTHYIATPVADLRRVPTGRILNQKDRDQETQALYGEPVELLEWRGDWALVALPDQPRWNAEEGWHGYRGWIERRHLASTPQTLPASTVKARWQETLSWGTRGTHLAPPESTFLDLAGPMIGTRYLWGGRSGEGVDCSGLVQLLYGMRGIRLPRNACDQARACTPIQLSELQPGDLIFRQTEEPPIRVEHVMLYLGNKEILEATEVSMSVRRLPLSEVTGTLTAGRVN